MSGRVLMPDAEAGQVLRSVSAEELSRMDGRGGSSTCWVSLHGLVFDVTEFKDSHPGGAEIILKYGGKDATDAFEALYHSPRARNMLRDLLVGRLQR